MDINFFIEKILKNEHESMEEDLELISFRKTNASVDENMIDLDNGEYILIETNSSQCRSNF